MMISSKTYSDEIKNYSIHELIKERDFLIQEIKRFENNEITPEEMDMKPSPSTIYIMNYEYLIEVIKCITKKI